MLNTYAATRETVRNTLTPFNMTEVKAANREMKKVFGDRLSQVKAAGSCEYLYYISVWDEEYGDWELDCFDWDFYYGTFAGKEFV